MPHQEINTAGYQADVVEKLKIIFGEDNVKNEWNVAKDSQDDYGRHLYCPRIDVAVGPFNISGEITRDNQRIIEVIEQHNVFIRKLVDNSETFVGNADDFLASRNKNPRCFLTIELEKSGSRKHLLGDIANASIIGAFGVVVGMNEDKLDAFKKIKKYIHFATQVDKLPKTFNNVIVLSRAKFMEIISE